MVLYKTLSFIILFFFERELELSLIKARRQIHQPEGKQPARKLQTQARRLKVVTRDTESLTTKLGKNLA
jgi:hypothetical protein